MFSRMVWTPEVATFFGCIAPTLASMTVWGVARPTVGRKGFLSIATTYGDRLFIGLLTAAHISLAWTGLTPEETSAWDGFIASMVVPTIVMWCG